MPKMARKAIPRIPLEIVPVATLGSRAPGTGKGGADLFGKQIANRIGTDPARYRLDQQFLFRRKTWLWNIPRADAKFGITRGMNKDEVLPISAEDESIAANGAADDFIKA